ncbi:glucose-6-phosphate isomerase [Gurleya vavrai]
MKELSDVFSKRKLLGANGKVIDTIVNIGIGGSDLGPKMVCQALRFYKMNDSKVYFVSNVDSTEILNVFSEINPDKTLFVVVSKTFTTQETLENAKFARELCMHKMKIDEKEVAKMHFIAISSNVEEVNKFGIETVFSMGDYVGGRYSLWSAAGVSICLYIGFENYLSMLEGASIMDEHFLNSEIPDNIPIMHAISELYYNNDLNYNNKCILPYDQYLEKLPSYLQQAEMESNGKSATRDNTSQKNTGMIIWGEVGTNAQHSFFQLIHQGKREILCEFLVGLKPIKSGCPRREKHHSILYANCVAQSEALMIGKEDKNLHKNFEGNKPSITITYTKLTPMVLGALLAMYEHKIFVQGFYWGINSYDQFGVELGKKLAKNILSTTNNEENGKGEHDPSTNALIELKQKK